MTVENKRIIEKRNLALRGREIWLAIKASNNLDENWALVIFPTENVELNKTAVEYLSDYLKKKYLNGVVLLTHKYAPFIAGISIDNCTMVSKCLSENDMEAIIMYYKLQQFFRNIVVVSIDEPFGCDAIIGKCDITLVDYVADAIFV